MTQMPVQTPRGDEIRAIVETRLAEARASGRAAETVRIEFRGEPTALEVVKMPVADLFYNPYTHRVRVQRAHDPIRDLELERDKFSSESQRYLHDLLRANPEQPDTVDPAFEKLREDLAKYEQNDPGIITPSGVLVNGNTRRAALRDLGKDHIRVAVLPADTTWADIEAIELELQLRPDFKREYSSVNRLVAINEMVEAGRSISEITKAFRARPKSIERDQWIYSFITEAIRRSETELADGRKASLRLMDFEGHAESLKELYRRYRQLSGDEAELLRESRLFSLMTDLAKTELRYVRQDFHERYLAPRLSKRFSPAEQSAPETGIPGFDAAPDLELPGDSDAVQQARVATDTLLQAATKANVSQFLSPAEREETTELIESATRSVRDAADESKAFDLREKRKAAAAERLREAVRLVEETTEQVAKARGQDLMEHQELDEAMVDLSAALKKLSKHASRGVETPGDGLTWLQLAVSNNP